MTIINEVKAASFMAKNMSKTINNWANELGLSHKETTRIYNKYLKLGLLKRKGFSQETRDRLSKFGKMGYHKAQAARLQQELEAA
jgi:DNA-binding Lrp family transcriptional regulator